MFTCSVTPSGKFFSSRQRLLWKRRFFWSSTTFSCSSADNVGGGAVEACVDVTDPVSSFPPPTTFCRTSLAQSPRPTLAVAKTLECSRGAAALFFFKLAPGVGLCVFAAIYAAIATAALARLASGNSCGARHARSPGGEGDPLMGLRGREEPSLDGN